MSAPVAITDADFQKEVVESPIPVVIDFWAPWCAPCRMVAPAIENLSKELDGKVRFVKINVDENQLQASKFGVQGIPTLLFFSGGELVDSAVGAYPEAVLRDKIAQTFGVETN
jgi:thioredoxin 1